MQTEEKIKSEDIRLLEILSQTFPNADSASTEIINLEAILNLPKGTEHFVADIHGEHEAFLHILRNASGNIKRKVTELFDEELTPAQISELCTLIYYPERRLEMAAEDASDEELHTYYTTTLFRLIQVCRSVSSKYTRSKVRKALPHQFAYIIEEMLHESPSDDDKEAYFHRIIESIILTGQAQNFITAICSVIQQLSIDRLHILGDIFDRGPGAHIIMDYLMQRDNFDIQWGNHDALWMGAAAGNECCIANVLRLSLRYSNMVTLEDGYGINLVPLATFAMDAYADDPCEGFMPITTQGQVPLGMKNRMLTARMHKAITIIQFKLEAQMRLRHPEGKVQWPFDLSNIGVNRMVCVADGKSYSLKDSLLPTVNPEAPNMLTNAEAELVRRLRHSFRISEKLQRHVQLLFSHGCMYNICNGNLLFHASVPLNADGTLKEVEVCGKKYSGRELMHHIGMYMRSAFQTDTPKAERNAAKDYFWYLWCGPDSPLFDKDHMTTFERYMLTDKDTYHEEKGHYFKLRDQQEVCDRILDAFGVEGEGRHIINGHVPVHAAQGENPVKAGGRLMVIDGGFSRAYHNTTGIAGYTLVYHSRGFQLIQHEPFTSTRDAILRQTDIKSSTQIVEMSGRRIRVKDTDKGRQLQTQIHELQQLLYAYRHGILKEK